jgi:hypothetical protein
LTDVQLVTGEFFLEREHDQCRGRVLPVLGMVPEIEFHDIYHLAIPNFVRNAVVRDLICHVQSLEGFACYRAPSLPLKRI